MLILLALPVLFAVSAIHRYLAVFAPTNLLVRGVRSHEPRWRTVAMLAAIAVGLLLAMHLVAIAVVNGAPGWLNLAVLVLAWDALKVGVLSFLQALRWAHARRRAELATGSSRLKQARRMHGSPVRSV
ncbi:hypothetical protein [Nocardioides sp. T2.26MG-1]|uniref:hypothetical protein n=1 Tax=Nocardioides sp. T2.26MG-1 TaxID=3041166 RepID=UPI0024775C88|nr:hypothetical protein [Nocardioides sp. T2.26MG-1]CAI9419251.1 hypothetical protein HIDPHFAB_03599 [Nocardioides sp. T2.26MG-1]